MDRNCSIGNAIEGWKLTLLIQLFFQIITGGIPESGKFFFWRKAQGLLYFLAGRGRAMRLLYVKMSQEVSEGISFSSNSI